MKPMTGIVLFLIGFATMDLQAQTVDSTKVGPIDKQPRGRNMISCTAYESIEYNGHTIDQISDTRGIASDVQQLFGGYTSVSEMSGARKRVFLYGNNRVSFNYEHGYVAGMGIKDSNWLITVLGKEVRVGDSFSELKQKFGNDLKIIHKPVLGPEYTVSFNCSGNDYDGVHINFNPISHEVEEIRYFVNT